jgi:hypothetical protein
LSPASNVEAIMMGVKEEEWLLVSFQMMIDQTWSMTNN